MLSLCVSGTAACELKLMATGSVVTGLWHEQASLYVWQHILQHIQPQQV